MPVHTLSRFPATPRLAMDAPILIVDDDADIRSVLQLLLEEEGYTVITADNGSEALVRIHQRTPSLVLLDLQMPLMTGWELQELLKVHYPALPVVFMTAGAHARGEAERHGARGYIAKPFDLSTVVDIVGRFLSQAAAS